MDALRNLSDERRLSGDEIAAALTAVQTAFRQVRPIILGRAGKVGGAYTDKSDGSPVTATDVEVEQTLLAELARRVPGVPVFGEETGYSDDLSGAFWLVDPIDGTSSFIAGVPAYTNMAVLIQGGEAAASAIYNVARDDMYVAQMGRGAFKNGVRLELRKIPLPRVAYCKGRFVPALNEMLQPKKVQCEIGPAGGGFGFTLVADGQSAARFNLLGGGYTHDYAPGALLVREAGGAILPVQDETYTYKSRSFIACHPELEPILRPHIAEIRQLEIELADNSK